MHHVFKQTIISSLLLAMAMVSITSCSNSAILHDREGKELQLEVDSIEKVSLNGTEQSIYLAGTDSDNPVILWLDGGPGGSEVGWVRTYLGPLHEEFTIVCWDQRGVAASYAAAKEGLEIEDFVQDTIALSELLRERFNQEKIFLLGHSWGGFIGALAAVERPDLFHAYIGAAPHVNSTENDTIGYHMILEGARKSGDYKTVRKLEELGTPPYEKYDKHGNLVGDGDAYYAVLSRLYKYSPHAPSDGSFRSEKMFLAPEHSLLSKINLVRGLVRSIKTVYPKARHMSLEEKAVYFQIPVFIINARYDVSCVAEITERWFNNLEAPMKQILWLEHSGHNGIYTESDAFIHFMRKTVLPVSGF